LAQVIEPLLQLSIKKAQQLGVDVFYVEKKKEKIILRLDAVSLSLLISAKNEITSCLACNKLELANKSLLFSNLSSNYLSSISQSEEKKGISERFYFHLNKKNEEILVFGSPANRSRGLIQLESCNIMMNNEFSRKDIFIKAIYLKEIKADIDMLKSFSGINSISLFGMKMNLLGRNNDINKVLQILIGKFDITESKPIVSCRNGDCCVCYCELDEEWFELLGCSHAGCKQCLENMFCGAENGDSEYLLPISCPSPECLPRSLWAFSDIVSITSERALSKIKKVSVDKFVLANKDRYKYCPNNGCNQILKIDKTTNKVGGFEVFCDQCSISYCFTCSEKSQNIVPMHFDSDCDENLRRLNPEIQDLVRHITDNILCIKCPLCKHQFLDFEGCFAISCGCKATFCGYCLKLSKDSKATHEHVLVCALGNKTHAARWEREQDC
jgi:hypothetical protein